MDKKSNNFPSSFIPVVDPDEELLHEPEEYEESKKSSKASSVAKPKKRGRKPNKSIQKVSARLKASQKRRRTRSEERGRPERKKRKRKETPRKLAKNKIKVTIKDEIDEDDEDVIDEPVDNYDDDDDDRDENYVPEVDDLEEEEVEDVVRDDDEWRAENVNENENDDEENENNDEDDIDDEEEDDSEYEAPKKTRKKSRLNSKKEKEEKEVFQKLLGEKYLKRIVNGQSVYECKYCSEQFPVKQKMLAHLKVHPEARTYICSVCNKSFVRASHLTQHRLVHSGLKPHECDLCGKHFGRLDHLNRHRLVHASELNVYKCQTCEEKFFTIARYVEHRRVHFDDDMFFCLLCGDEFEKKGLLDEHMVDHPKCVHKCRFCDKAFESERGLVRHCTTHSNEKTKKFACEQCGKEYFKIKILEKHKLTHLEPTSYVCEICGATFDGKSKFMWHKKTHHIEKKFECGVCKKMFISETILKRHQVYHSKDWKYSCEFCGKLFPVAGALNYHRRVHTGERPFKCDLCDKAFTIPSKLRIHRRIHTGEKPYECEICGRGFRKSSKLTEHRRTHTGEKPYFCTECGKSFTRSYHLAAHKRSIHAIGNPPFKRRRPSRAKKKKVAENPVLDAAVEREVKILGESGALDFTRPPPKLNSGAETGGMAEFNQSAVRDGRSQDDLKQTVFMYSMSREDGTVVYQSSVSSEAMRLGGGTGGLYLRPESKGATTMEDETPSYPGIAARLRGDHPSDAGRNISIYPPRPLVTTKNPASSSSVVGSYPSPVLPRRGDTSSNRPNIQSNIPRSIPPSSVSQVTDLPGGFPTAPNGENHSVPLDFTRSASASSRETSTVDTSAIAQPPSPHRDQRQGAPNDPNDPSQLWLLCNL